MRNTVAKKLRRQHGNPDPGERTYGPNQRGDQTATGMRGAYRKAKKDYREGKSDERRSR